MTVENWCHEAQKNVSGKRECNLEKSWYKILKEASVKVVGLRSGQTGVSTLPGRAAKLDVIAQNLRHILAKLSFWFSLVLKGHKWEKSLSRFLCNEHLSFSVHNFGPLWFGLVQIIWIYKKVAPHLEGCQKMDLQEKQNCIGWTIEYRWHQLHSGQGEGSVLRCLKYVKLINC